MVLEEGRMHSEHESEEAMHTAISVTERLISEMVAKPSADKLQNFFDAYKSRLQSFSPATYFAKPVCISPIICAMTGWRLENTDKSTLLSCKSCSSVLVILIPPSLSSQAAKELAVTYQEKLWTAHADSCRYRKEAEYCLRPRAITEIDETNAIPSLLARMLPVAESSLELVESLAPWSLFCDRFLKLNPHIMELEQSIDVPAELLCYEAVDGTSDTLLNRLLDQMQENQIDADVIYSPAKKELAKATIALILTGWDLECDAERRFIKCICCLSRHRLEKTKLSTGSQPKRRKVPTWNQPLLIHRYYCPWVCGFATAEKTSKPLWQIVAGRLLSEKPVCFNPDSVPEIHKMLKSSISTRRLKLPPKD